MSRPPIGNDHSWAFTRIVGFMLIVTFSFGAWVWQAQTNELADAVREMRVNP